MTKYELMTITTGGNHTTSPTQTGRLRMIRAARHNLQPNLTCDPDYEKLYIMHQNEVNPGTCTASPNRTP